MDIAHKRYQRVDVIALNGRLDAVTAPLLKSKLDSLFGEGRDQIILDLANLEYVSSPGLRVLIEARKRARDRRLAESENGDLRIVHLPPRIKEVFDLTGFISLFDVFDDLTDAVGSF